ncbi:MAG: magnesium transporter [Acidimicrobiaceae bacterium]|nr:magnesium transporter [Acidimicrobiaceae bacterium]
MRAATRWARDLLAVRSAFGALVMAAVASLVAGLILASITDTLEELPGLLLLVPAAIAVKGNIFGALGSRLGTSIHAGTFRLSNRWDSVMAQNAVASVALSLALGVALAVMAKGAALAFNISPTMSLADFVVISALGCLIAAFVVLAFTLATTAGAVRYGWDLDNVVAPMVTVAGDVVTLPSLVVAAELAGFEILTPSVAWTLGVVSVLSVVWALRSRLLELRTIMRESIPVLIAAGMLDLVAGITVEKRIDDFVTFPVLLVLLPGYLATAGALGGVLSSRLSTKLHLGLARPSVMPSGEARVDLATTFALSIPVFALLGLVSSIAAGLTGHAGPSLAELVAVAVLGGLLATVLIVVVAYYGTLAAVRFGLDPDTYGIPMVTSSLDLAGAFTLIVSVVLVGVV